MVNNLAPIFNNQHKYQWFIYSVFFQSEIFDRHRDKLQPKNNKHVR